MIIFLLLLILIIYAVSKLATQRTVISNWHQLFDISFSTQDFYALVENFLMRKDLGGVKLSRITYAERGLFSARREYLRVQYKNYVFDICAAPFANDFFVSWWHSELSNSSFDFLKRIPILKIFMVKRQKTFYEMDTENMFKESVKVCVSIAVKQMTEPKGVRLSDDASINGHTYSSNLQS